MIQRLTFPSARKDMLPRQPIRHVLKLQFSTWQEGMREEVDMRITHDGKTLRLSVVVYPTFGPHKGTSILCPGLTPFVKLWFFRISWWLSRNADFGAPSSRSIRSMYSSGKANFAPNHPTVSVAEQDNGLCSLRNPIRVNGDWVLYFTRYPGNSSSGSTTPYDLRVLHWVFCVHTNKNEVGLWRRHTYS